MKTKNIISVLLLVIFSATTSAQNSWQWAARAGGVGMGNSSPDATINSMVTDAAGNVYVCGTILGPGATAGSMPLTTYGSFDIYVAKYDCAGNLIWARTAGSLHGDKGQGIELDNYGNIYLIGYAYGNNLYPNTFFDTTLSSLSSASFFITKLDTAGNFKWVKASPLISQGYKIIKLNDTFNVLLSSSQTGNFFAGHNVDPGYYFTTFDTAGNVLDMLRWNAYANANDFIVSPTNDYYITGSFNSDSAVFGNNDTVLYKIATGFSGRDIFLCKFDANGNFIWVSHFGYSNPSGIYLYGLVFYNNDILITGDAKHNMIIGNDTMYNSLNSTPTFPFVALISTENNILWAVNSHHQYVSAPTAGISVYNNKAQIGCAVRGQSIFGNTIFPGTVGLQDVIIAEIDLTTQSFTNAVKIDGTGDKERPQSITADNNGNIYIGGAFDGTMTVGSSTITSAGGNTDAFIAKWGPGNCLTSIEEIVADLPANSLFIYPNPAKEYFNIAAKGINGNTTVILYNSLAQNVKKHKINISNNQPAEINISGLPKGIYFVELLNGKERKTGKLIVE